MFAFLLEFEIGKGRHDPLELFRRFSTKGNCTRSYFCPNYINVYYCMKAVIFVEISVLFKIVHLAAIDEKPSNISRLSFEYFGFVNFVNPMRSLYGQTCYRF